MMRPFRGGQGSYDLIVPKFQKMAESRNQTNYYVRGTFTHYNLDFAKDVLHMADLGFKQISVEPVVAPPEAVLRHPGGGCAAFSVKSMTSLAAEMVRREKAGRGILISSIL